MVLLCGQPLILNQINLQHVHEPLRQRIVVHHKFRGLEPGEIEEFLTALLMLGTTLFETKTA